MHLSLETPTPSPRGDVGHETAERKKEKKAPPLRGASLV